jgi:hypothetical protein
VKCDVKVERSIWEWIETRARQLFSKKSKPVSVTPVSVKAVSAEIAIPAKATKKVKATALLRSLQLPCSVARARAEAAKHGISPRTLSRAYPLAGVVPKQLPGSGTWVLRRANDRKGSL